VKVDADTDQDLFRVKLTYFSENLSRHVILQVAQGIRHLHEERGVVHRQVSSRLAYSDVSEKKIVILNQKTFFSNGYRRFRQRFPFDALTMKRKKMKGNSNLELVVVRSEESRLLTLVFPKLYGKKRPKHLVGLLDTLPQKLSRMSDTARV
jgi:hypothetical protein